MFEAWDSFFVDRTLSLVAWSSHLAERVDFGPAMQGHVGCGYDYQRLGQIPRSPLAGVAPRFALFPPLSFSVTGGDDERGVKGC